MSGRPAANNPTLSATETARHDCGGPHRFLRDDQSWIPSGPEGSSGSGDVGCRGL